MTAKQSQPMPADAVRPPAPKAPPANKIERRFPMQRGPSIPWSMAEIIYAGYTADYGTQQSLERLAQRGGFSWAEVEVIYKSHRARAAMDKLTGDK